MFRFDESDPHYLIAYEDRHEHSIEPYLELMRRWLARCERPTPFGVVLVNTDHAYEEAISPEHAATEARNVALEEAYTKMLNDFRRGHKADVERRTVGFVRIFPSRWVQEESSKSSTFLDELHASQERAVRYMWGVPGAVCETVDEARAWIDAQIAVFVQTDEASSSGTDVTVVPGGQRVGLFFGSTTGVTESAALEIAAVWSAFGMDPIQAVNIGMVKDLSVLMQYDYLILGISTWNVGQLQDDWEIALAQMDTLDFTGKTIALFGAGDQYGYPDNFLDAVGILGEKLAERGALLAGRWSTRGYEFSESKALADGEFMGLALDDVQQSGLTNARINQWVTQLITEFELQPQASH
ncbi:MAG: flavodoxin [Anaerolineae bacterium]